jgi:hypothetical protein
MNTNNNVIGVGCDALFAGLCERKWAIEFRLGDAEDYTGWIERPDHAGWWLWLEGGSGCRTELLLIDEGGTHVAGDDEWEQAAGKPVDGDGWEENYWQGTETTQKQMPGLWLSLANV